MKNVFDHSLFTGFLVFCFLNTSIAQRSEKYFTEGQNLAEKREYKAAIEAYSKAIKSDDRLAKAFYRRGVAYNAVGEGENAFKDFTRCVELDSSNIDYLATQAYMCSEYYEKHEMALKNYTRIIALEPSTPKAYISRGIVYLRLKQYDLANQDFSKEILLNPELANGYVCRGISFFRMGYDSEAITDLTKALSIDSTNMGSWIYRGQARSSQKQYQLALQDFNKALAIKPGNFKSLTGMAIVYFNLKDEQNTQKYFQLLIDKQNLLKIGAKGIDDLERQGYTFTLTEKRDLILIFDQYLPSIKKATYEIKNIQTSYGVSYTKQGFAGDKSIEKAITAKDGFRFMMISGVFLSNSGSTRFPKNTVFLTYMTDNQTRYAELSDLQAITGMAGSTKKAEEKTPVYWLGQNPSDLKLFFEIPLEVNCGINLNFVDTVIEILKSCDNEK